jgi:glycosyltransferase involved in cell wall biosynthesis
MKVLVIIFEELYPLSGGGTPRVSNLARAFSRRGHEVWVAAGIGSPEREARDYLGCREIVPLRSVSRLDPGKMRKYLLFHPLNILKVIRAVRKCRPDLVVSHNTIAGYGALRGKRLSRSDSRLVLDLTDVLFEYLDDYGGGGWLKLVQKLGRKLERAAIRASDRIITISASMKEIIQSYGVAAEAVDVVCDGVDLEIFRRSESQNLRRKYAPGQETVVLFQGVIDPQDGPELLAAAAREVIGEYPRTAFWIVGEGSAVPGLKQLVREAGIEDSFHFSGWVRQEEVARYLSAGDIGLVILPDIISARGRVTLKEFEYWACGLPVIAPRLPALQEVIEEGVTGLFYRPGEAGDLAEKIKRLIKEKDLSRRMGEKGKKLVREKYRWDELADEFVLLCEEYVK